MNTECPYCGFDDAYYDAGLGKYFCPRCDRDFDAARPFIRFGIEKYMMW